jgi:hypothetical protein
MNRTRTSWALLLVAVISIDANAQTLQTSRPGSDSATNMPAVRTITLSLPTGTPLQIAWIARSV